MNASTTADANDWRVWMPDEARHLYVFQRTPNFSMPARNAPLDPDALAGIKSGYRERRRLCRESVAGLPYTHPDVAPSRSALDVGDRERARAFEEGWVRGGIACVAFAFNDIGTDLRANAYAADFVHGKIAETVADPAVARLLMPRDYPLGAKRLCVDTGYYQTYNRDNVTLVDVREYPIIEVTERGLRTAAAEYDLDALVFATGFDAITGALREIDIRGRDGTALADAWASGPRAYLGLAMAGFPNLFAESAGIARSATRWPPIAIAASRAGASTSTAWEARNDRPRDPAGRRDGDRPAHPAACRRRVRLRRGRRHRVVPTAA